MTRNHPTLESRRAPIGWSWILLALSLALVWQVKAQPAILHLKNGDRLAGTIISEDTNRVVLTTTWIKELTVPLAAISSREKPPAERAAGITNTPSVTNVVATSATNALMGATISTNAALAGATTTTNKPSGGGVNTNLVASAKPGVPVAIPAPPGSPVKPGKPKHWKLEGKLGADFLYGAKDQQIYYGRLKLSYELPYTSNPKKFFRNILDYGLDYGRTADGASSVISANRMDGSDKTDFDIGNHFYLYNLGGAGYDDVRKIDLHYELGPGLGYHLLRYTNFVMDVELGANYQAQYRSDNTDTKKFYYRFAESVTWKFNKRFTFTEKAEYFPQVEEPAQYRARFEANLAYALWQNISLNVSLLDLYDTQPAATIPKNDLQIRSSLGFTF